VADDNDNDDIKKISDDFKRELTENTPESITRQLNRRAAMLKQQSRKERQRKQELDEHKANRDRLDAKFKAASGVDLSIDEKDTKEMRFSQSRIEKIGKEFGPGRKWENYRIDSAESEFLKSTNTFIGKRSTDEQISRAARAQSNLGAINKTAGSRTSSQLVDDVKKARSELVTHQEEMRSVAEAGGVDDTAYMQASQSHEEKVRKLGILTGAQSKQARDKTDLAGRQQSLESIMKKIGKDQMKQQVSKDIASGNMGSRVDEKGKLDSLSKEIMEAGKAFKEALGGSKEKVEELGKKIGDLTTEYNMQSEVVTQMDSPSSKSKAAMWTGTAADVLAVGANSIKTIGVDQEMRDIANKAGFAAIANQEYEDQGAALGGDMAAFRRIDTDQYSRAADKAGWSGALTNTALHGGAAADAAAVAASALEKGLNLSTVFEFGSATSEAISEGSYHAFNATAKEVDAFRGISSGEAERARFDAEMNKEDTIMRARDINAQTYRDSMGGNIIASRGSGSNRGSLFAQMESASNRGQLAALGMGSDEMQGIYAQGISEMGSDFKGAKAGRMVTRAAELQKAGIMGASEYMSSMGQLNKVGGDSGNMESIMKNAVAAGMDSSRNIQQMVSGIGSLSTASALQGISTTVGATQMMGLGIQSKSFEGMSNEMKTAAATSQIGNINKSMSDTSMNMYTVAEMAGLRDIAPDMSLAEQTRFASLSLTELQSIRYDKNEKDPEKRAAAKKKAMEARNKLGLGLRTDDQVEEMSKVSIKAEVAKMATMLSTTEDKNALMTAVEGSREDMDKFLGTDAGMRLKAAVTQTPNGAAALEMLGSAYNNDAPKDGKKPGEGGLGDDDKVNAGEGILATKFQAMELQIARGQKIFKELYGNIEGFNKKLKGQLGDYKPGEAEARAELAGEGSLQTRGFDGSVSDFSKAVAKFVAGIEGKKDTTGGYKPTVPKQDSWDKAEYRRMEVEEDNRSTNKDFFTRNNLDFNYDQETP
jgi:hypothetical protein